MPEDDLLADMKEIREFVGQAGGSDALTVREVESKRMGSDVYVEVLVPDSAETVAFHSLQNGGRYLVAPDNAPDYSSDDDGQTADPNPPSQ